MSELTDDQLDGLFRKSAEEFDPPFDPAAWRDMKTRLDADDRNPAGGIPIWKNLLRWGLPLVLLLLLSSGGWYAYRRLNSTVVKSNSRMIPGAGPTLNQTAKRSQPVIAIPTSDNEPARTTTVGSKESEAAKQPTDPVVSVAEPARLGKRLDKPVIHSESNTASGPDAATKRPESTYKPKAARTGRGVRAEGVGHGSAYKPKTEYTQLNDSRLAKLVDAGGHKPVETARSRRGNTALNEKGIAEATGYAARNTNSRRGKLTRTRRNLPDGQYRIAFTEINQTSVLASSARKRRRASSQPLIVRNAVDGAGAVTPPVTHEIGPVTLPMLADLKARPATWPTLSVALNRPVTTQPDTTARRVVSQLTAPRGLSIRVVIAPDLSTVGLKNFSRPGTNVGLLLEYRLAARWSVQAGVIQSTKLYRSLPDEYTAHAGEWGGPVEPLSVDGRCNILDIPLNLRYDIRIRPRRNGQLESRWFVSGGVTSYVMKQEDYVYNYPPHTYWQTMSTNVSTGNYGLSQVNLSVGYERALSRRLSWQIEPFVKVPLKGVGYFRTDLFSTGAFFSIRCKLSK